MAKSILDKMFLKPDYSVAILNLPKELEAEISTKAAKTLAGHYNFILAFYTEKQKLNEEVTNLRDSLLPNGLLWLAYPKNKALETDLNRDILHTSMNEHGFDGVSLVSLNDTWSAMRFKII
jgi:hypothetical protein